MKEKKELQYEEKLRSAALDLNEVIKPDPPIELSVSVEQLKSDIIEVAGMLAEGDAIKNDTAETLKELGVTIVEGVKVVDTEKKTKDKTKTTEPSASNAKTAKVTKAGEWRQGSSAQIILETARSIEGGATVSEILETVRDRFRSANPKARVTTVLHAAVQRGLLKKTQDGKYLPV